MNKFHFSLDRVLKIREIREQEARETVGRRQSELAGAENRRAVLAAIGSRIAAEERRHRLGSIVAAALQTGQEYLTDVRGQVEVATGDVDAAAGELRTAQTDYIGRQVERKAISSLRDKRSQEYWFTLLREEQKLIDEMASRRKPEDQGQPVFSAPRAAAAGSNPPGGLK